MPDFIRSHSEILSRGAAVLFQYDQDERLVRNGRFDMFKVRRLLAYKPPDSLPWAGGPLGRTPAAVPAGQASAHPH